MKKMLQCLKKRRYPLYLGIAALISLTSIAPAQVNLASAYERSYHKKPANTDALLSIKLHNAKVKEVLDAIEARSDMKFVYDQSILNYEWAFTFDESSIRLYDLLQKISEESDLRFKQVNNNINVRLEKRVVETSRAAVDVTVTGTVRDQNGAPLPGVTVSIPNTGMGTATDMDGRYSLTVPEGATLVFSFIGFVSETVEVGNNNVIDVILQEDIASLDEIVVVGYGTQKKSVVTGAISSVKASDLENQQIGRLEQALQGRTSGLTIASNSGAPGAAATVRVRGATSLNESASNPLYVVDGVVVEGGTIDYLNPSDIESMEVLKDAASAAIYGARSSAGVILITTKKGKSGELRVNYNGYLGTQAPAKKLDLLNAMEYATLRNEQALADNNDIVFENVNSLGEGTDWQSQIFNNNALIQNHEVSISGGGERSTFYSSFGFFDQEGIVASEISRFKRHNIRLNSSHKIREWLTIGQTLGYSRINSKGGVGGNTDFGGPLSSAIMMDPLTPVVITDPDVANSVPYSTQPVVRDPHGNPYGISSIVQQQVTNPLAYIQTRRGNFSWSDDIVGNAFVEASLIKGLSARSTVGVRLTYSGGENFTPIYYLNSNQESVQTSYAKNRQQIFNWNLENTVSYSRLINDHDFSILIGQGAYLDNNSSGLNVTYYNLPVNTFEEASMNYDISADDIVASGYEGINHTVSSLFSRVTYNYAEKYLFTGIIRRDGSSRFGTNNKYGYFPSASVGWVASEEAFWQNNRVVNFLKVRGSYGVTGNDVLGNFRYLSTVGGGRNYSFGLDNYLIGYSPDAPANPDLRWEETSQLNFGLDMVLFENWTASLDWYHKETNGILQIIQLPGYAGATGNPYGNVADMANRGIELELNYNKQVGEVQLDLSGNASYLKNEVTFLGEGKAFLEGGATIQNSSYAITRTAVGHAIGSFYGFETAGIFQNQGEVDAYVGPSGTPIQPDAKPGDFRWVDLNGDGRIDADDRTFIGDPTPDWSFGLTFNAVWRNFDFLVFGQGVAGNQIFQALRRMDIPTANWQRNALDRWHGGGTSDSYPRLTVADVNKNFANPSVFHLKDGDYFRIKTLQIGYTLPQTVTERIGMYRARVYVSSNNLLTITKYPGFDPEIGGSSYGIDRAIYPQSRSLLLGLNIGF